MPQEFGRYELQDLLGRGGMGEVYRALDTVRDRTVALKLLSKHLATDETFKTRFRRESRMVARLNEPHIIPIHDFGEIDGQLYIDMRLVEGDDLGTVLDRGGAMAAELAVGVIAQVAAALDAAHQTGLTHRDVKPSNVLLTGLDADRGGDPFAYLVDFGIARSSAQEGTALTATTGTVGTVAYMSPERIGGEPGDSTTDTYALACVLYETLTGRKPFEGEMFAIMYAHMHTAPPKVTALAPGAPPGLDDVIRKGMAKDPQERYASAGDLARAARGALRAAAAAAASNVRSQPATRPAPPRNLPPPNPATRVAGPPPPAASQTGYSPPRQVVSSSYATPPPASNTPPPPSNTSPPQSWSSPPGGAAPPGGEPPYRVPHPSGPIPWPEQPKQPRSRRTAVLAGAVAVVLVAAAVVAVIIATHHGGSNAVAKTSPVNSPHTTAAGGQAGVPTTLNTGGAGTGKIAWAHFGPFAKLVGTKDGDSAHAFKKGSCKVGGPATSDVPGLADQVECTYPGAPVQAFVARFDSASDVQTYLATLSDTRGYSETAWTTAGESRGVEYVSPGSATDVDVTASVCALPTYLVQFYVADKTKLALQSVLDDYWTAATIPDAVPPACNASFTAAVPGPATTGATPAKGAASLDAAALNVLLERNDSHLTAIAVAVPTRTEFMVVAQTGKVSFWAWRNSSRSLIKVGASTYPYDPASVGPPGAKGSGALLTGMVHATFILTGTFSGDGSGNAVAYTASGADWGAIKAIANGNLAPSKQGVTFGGIGLGDGFAFVDGQLETADCSGTKPISECGGNNRVLKFWGWKPELSQFTLVRTAGLPK